MALTLLKRLVARLRRPGAETEMETKTETEPEPETETEADEESRFVPSPLDRSVRKGHGGSGDEAARELARIDEQAREVEERRRDH